jgi:3-oxoacyl-[acyl-carrier-protein] synthase II
MCEFKQHMKAVMNMTNNDDSGRVVVTGMGTLNPLGNNVESFWDALISGQSGVSRMTLIDPTEYECQIAGEIKDFDYSKYMDRKAGRRIARFSQIAVGASRMALEQAGLETSQMNESDRQRIGVIVGNGGGAIDEDQRSMETIYSKGPSRVDPFYISKRLGNMAGANIAIEFGLLGYNGTLVTACAAGTQALGEAFEIIKRGSCDVMLAGGVEAGISQLGLAGFSAMKAVSVGFNDDPTKGSRPFDKHRTGFVPAEGAAILVLESLAHARQRGAEPLAEIIGFGCSADASFLVAPAENGAGAARAIRLALENARINPQDIDVISAHATSTGVGDIAETRALHSVFREHVMDIPIYAAKSMTGHMLAASGAVETIALIEGLRHSIVPPTINLESPDEECDLDYVPHEARDVKSSIVINNSFGFGGQNSVLVLRDLV